MNTRPAWVEISRQHLLANHRALRTHAGGAELLAVVKANAYGHGLEHCAPLLTNAGAEWLGVTCAEEGAAARRFCRSSRILVLSGLWKGEAEAAIEYGLTPVVWERFHLDEFEAAAHRRRLAPGSVAVHLELDTGMARQGVSLNDPCALDAILARFDAASPLRIEGVMTHFSSPEMLDDPATAESLMRLEHALERITARGLRPRWLNAGNSATLLAGRDTAALDALATKAGARLMLRPGLSLYGYAPRFLPAGQIEAAPLEPVLSWKTRIVSLRTIEAGQTAGYNGTFRARRRTQLALIAAGYADGLNRLLSNRGEVLVRGLRAPIAGRVSMDQTIVDVTDVPGAEIGDEVVLIGRQGGQRIDACDHADWIGSIPYEVLTSIGARVPRLTVE